MTETIRLLDPTNELQPQMRPKVPPPEVLHEKTVALLDISKPRGDVLLARLGEQLMAAGVRVNRYRKPTYSRPAPIDLVQEIAAENDLIVEALAD